MLPFIMKLKVLKIVRNCQDNLNWIFLWTVKWQLRLNSQKVWCSNDYQETKSTYTYTQKVLFIIFQFLSRFQFLQYKATFSLYCSTTIYDQCLVVLFFCHCSIYLELNATLYVVPHQSRLLSESSQNLPFWLTFFSVSFNFLYIHVVVCIFVAIYHLASYECCLYLREAPLYRQTLLVQPCL